MGSNGAVEISKGDGCQGSETTIEIKIKTLDSQTYTLRVNKQMPVPALKEQIASVTGVLSEQQRLICRGRVLKDDQLLSAYHVEDGHTLHMVVGQPAPPSSGSLHSHPASDPASSASHGQRIQVAPGVVVETFDITDQGDGVLPDINRIVSAVLGAFGINSTGSGNEGVDGQARDSGGLERMFSSSGMTASTHLQPEQAGLTGQSDRPLGAFGFPTASSLGPLQPRVIPDSLTTLTEYLSHMRQQYGANGGNSSHDAAIRGIQSRESNSSLPSLPAQERLPTPEMLAEVLLSTRELLMEQTAECLLQLGRELHNQSNVTDPIVRLSTQSNAWRSGTLFHNLGAFLLELGRTTMTLRMGQTSSEAVVSAGPAVFISQSGPNPLMVQPLPFQPGTSFGVIPPSTGQHGSGLGNDSGAGFVPRRIDIQIRRGSSAVRENVNQEEHGGEMLVNQVTPAASEGLSRPTQSGVRLVPVRTMLAAIPGQLGRLPGLGRFQHIASGHLNSRRGFQAFGEQHANGLHTELHPIPESGVQQNTENRASDNSTNAAAEQGSLPPPNSRRFRFSVLSTGATENDNPAEREVPSEVFQVLRSLFPAGEIHVEDAGSQRTATGPVTDNAGTTSTAMDAPEAEHRVSDEGIFFSNVLRQIMPFISQLPGAPPDVSTEPAYASEQRTAHESSIEAENSDVGTSRQQSDVQPIPPNSKRQKME